MIVMSSVLVMKFIRTYKHKQWVVAIISSVAIISTESVAIISTCAKMISSESKSTECRSE